MNYFVCFLYSCTSLILQSLLFLPPRRPCFHLFLSCFTNENHFLQGHWNIPFVTYKEKPPRFPPKILHLFCGSYLLRTFKQRRHPVKNELIFYQRNSQLSRSVRYANGSKNVLKLNMQSQRSIPNGNTKDKPSSLAFVRLRRTPSFRDLGL